MKFSKSLSLKEAFSKGIILPALLIALAVIIFVIELTILVFAHLEIISTHLNYSWAYPVYGYNISLAAILFITWMVIFGLVYVTILLVPALWFGAKRGWKAAALIMIFECMWFVFFGVMMSVYFPRWVAPVTSEPPSCIDCAYF